MNTIHPVHIKNITIPSNVFFAPINPGGCIDGIITNEYMDFFIKHSGHGVGICYVGNVALQKEWTSNANTAVLSLNTDEQWKVLSEQIASNGSLPGIQLAWKPHQIILQRSFTANDKSKQIKLFKEFYNSFNDFDTVAELFTENIQKAAALGFSVIQIHAAHGYALSLLLSRTISKCNNPNDTKGIKLLKQITDKLDSKKIILDIRLSLYEGIDDENNEIEYKALLAELLAKYGFDIISLSNGFYNIDKKMIYPPKNSKTVILDDAVCLAKKYTNIIWNVAGNMEEALMCEQKAPDNLTFSLGRQLLSDCNAVIKLQKNKYDYIQKCSECNACHYYSYGLPKIQNCRT